MGGAALGDFDEQVVLKKNAIAKHVARLDRVDQLEVEMAEQLRIKKLVRGEET